MLPINTNDLDILESFTFLVPDHGKTSIRLVHAGEELTFEIFFVTSKEEDSELSFAPSDHLTMRITFKNWGGPFATSTVKPVHVGSIGGRELSLLIAVTRLGDNSEIRSVIFTAYLGGEVANG